MANPKYSRKTTEERKQEIKNLSEKALKEIEKYTTSPEDLLEYADFISRFHNYSLNNLGLIQNQFRGARAVASFKDWKDKGYFVNKGEKGIEILSYAPITLFKDKDGQTKMISEASKEEKDLIKQGKIETRKVANFKKGHVFDISQTNAPVEDLPKIFPNKQFNFQIEEGNNAAHLRKGIEAVAQSLNIEIKDMKESSMNYGELGTAKGIYIENLDGSKREILLNSRNTETQNLATSIHELAHARMHHSGSEYRHFDNPTLEFQAELTSYIVCKHYGMDTSDKAIPYIANWTANGQKIEEKQKAMEGVHKSVSEFINIMDPVISREREMEQEQINYHDELLLIQENHGLLSKNVNLENTEFWRKLEYTDPEDYNKYLMYKPLYEHELEHGEVKFEEPMMYIHGVTNEFKPFGEANNIDLTPYKFIEQQYTVVIPEDEELITLSAKYDSAMYVHPLHHIKDNQLLDKETINKLDEHWNEQLAKVEQKHLEQWKDQYLKAGTFQVNSTNKGTEQAFNSVFSDMDFSGETTGVLYPKDDEEIVYCDLTGEPIGQDEEYYHLEGSWNISESALDLIYSKEEWESLYEPEGDNYYTTCFYDLDESEMTTKKPEKLNLDDKNKYYFYDGQSKPVELGTFSEIVSAAEKQELIGHFSSSKEFVRELMFSRSEDKQNFNEYMENFHVLKNPTLKDFQKLNEKLGKDKDSNLEGLDLGKDLNKRTQMLSKHQQMSR